MMKGGQLFSNMKVTSNTAYSSGLSMQEPCDGTQGLEHSAGKIIIFSGIMWDKSLGKKITCHNKLLLVYPL